MLPGFAAAEEVDLTLDADAKIALATTGGIRKARVEARSAVAAERPGAPASRRPAIRGLRLAFDYTDTSGRIDVSDLSVDLGDVGLELAGQVSEQSPGIWGFDLRSGAAAPRARRTDRSRMPASTMRRWSERSRAPRDCSRCRSCSCAPVAPTSPPPAGSISCSTERRGAHRRAHRADVDGDAEGGLAGVRRTGRPPLAHEAMSPKGSSPPERSRPSSSRRRAAAAPKRACRSPSRQRRSRSRPRRDCRRSRFRARCSASRVIPSRSLRPMPP